MHWETLFQAFQAAVGKGVYRGEALTLLVEEVESTQELRCSDKEKVLLLLAQYEDCQSRETLHQIHDIFLQYPAYNERWVRHVADLLLGKPTGDG